MTAALIGAAAFAFAGDQGDPDKGCDGSTYEIVDCLNAQTAQWDKRMNVAYQRALHAGEPKQREQLRAAQRLWIQYRDANCLYYGLGDGTIARIEAGECMLTMTQARANRAGRQGRPQLVLGVLLDPVAQPSRDLVRRCVAVRGAQVGLAHQLDRDRADQRLRARRSAPRRWRAWARAAGWRRRAGSPASDRRARRDRIARCGRRWYRPRSRRRRRPRRPDT